MPKQSPTMAAMPPKPTPAMMSPSATVIWPHGTKITSDDPLTIEVPGLGGLQVDDQVDGGGVEYGDHLPKGIDAVPEGCPTEQVFEFYPNR